MIKKLSKILIKTAVISTLLLSVSTFAYALVDDYTVLTPLPGTTGCEDGKAPTQVKIGPDGKTTGGCQTTFETYLPGMFKLFIGIAGVLAFIMISYGGFLYMTSDAISGKSSGREYIENAVWGLVLVIGSWVILNTINPQLLQFDLNISKPPTLAQEASVETAGGPIVPFKELSDAEKILDAKMRVDLKSNHVTVNNGICTGGQTKGCTNLVGLPDSAYSGVKNVASSCSCDVMITGGTEGGHSSHNQGNPAMDLSLNNKALNDYIAKNIVSERPVNFGDKVEYTVKINGSNNATFVKESATNHWHVVFK